MASSDQLVQGTSPAVPEVTQVYDNHHGRYVSNVPLSVPTEARLTTAAFPKAADPQPFAIGGYGTGER